MHRITVSLPDTDNVRALLAAKNRSRAVLSAIDQKPGLDLDPATLAALSAHGSCPYAVARAAIRLALTMPLQLATAVALAQPH